MFTTAMIRNILHNRAEYIKSIKKRKKKSYIIAAAELEAKMNNLDFTQYKFPLRNYLIFCNFCDWFLVTRLFSNYMLMMIILAGLLVGLTTYPSMENSSRVAAVDAAVFYSFLIELCLKIFSEGLAPQLFFINSEWRWNWFDTLIVLFSFPQLPVSAGSVKLLRLVRLARIGKLLRKFPSLLMIFKGLIGGLKSCIYIVILMVLLLYMFAVAGVLFFRENDPFHFQTIEVSFITLLRMATLDNWGQILYINYFGCDVYDGGLYCTDCDAGGSPPLECNNPHANPGLFVFYSVLYIFSLAFCVLSLFIGTVTTSMSESIITMKEEENLRRIEVEKKIMGEKAKEFEDVKRLDRKNKRKVKLVYLAFHGFQLKEEALAAEFKVNFNSITSIYSYLAEHAHNVVSSSNFNSLMISTIMVAAVTVGIQTDEKGANDYAKYSNYIDSTVQGVFLAEVVLKIIAEDLKPWRYFYDSWNNFDFFVVMISFVPTGSGSLVTMLRLLRLLRVMKLMRALPQLQNIIFALSSGTKSISYISVILILYFYVYAIIGQVLFQESDPHRFGRLHYAMLVLFQMSTFDGWSDLMYTTQYGCDMYGYSPEYQYECAKPQKQWAESAIFWVIFVIIGGLVLLSLFIGVVGIGMEESNQMEHNTAKLLKRAADVAEKEGLTDSEIKLYKEVFDIVDFASGGSIGKAEMLLGLKVAGMDLNEEDFSKLWGKLDRDGSGNIEFVEFLQFMLFLKKLVGNSNDDSPTGSKGTIDGKRRDRFSAMLMNKEAVPEPVPDKIAEPVPKKQGLKRWGKIRASLCVVKAMKVSEGTVFPTEGNETPYVTQSSIIVDAANLQNIPIGPMVSPSTKITNEMEVQTDLQIPINLDNINNLDPYHQYLLIASGNEAASQDLMQQPLSKVDDDEDIRLFQQQQENIVVDNSTEECLATVDNMKQMAKNLKKEESMKQHPHPIISEQLQKHIQLPASNAFGGDVNANVVDPIPTNINLFNVPIADQFGSSSNNAEDENNEEEEQNTIGGMMSRALGWGKRSPQRSRPTQSLTMQFMERVPNSRIRKKPLR